MSITERKILIYELKKEIKGVDEKEDFFEFNLLADYIRNHKIEFEYTDEKRYKWYSIEDVYYKDGYYHIILINCKYNHSPNYINIISKQEKTTSKGLDDGEKELTHVLIKGNTVYYEKRLSGTGAYIFVKFINSAMKHIEIMQHQEIKKISLFQIIRNDFFALIKKSNRIKSIKYNVTTELKGSEYFDFNDDDGVQDVYSVKLKAKRKRSFNKENLIKRFEKIFSSESEIKKITVEINDDNNQKMIINSEEFARFFILNVETNSQGIIESSDMFNKIKELIKK